MSDALYGKPAENTGSVREKLKLFPEVHMYKDEKRPARIKPVEAAPRNKREGRKLERVFVVVILFLVLVLAGELVFHFLISPKLMIRKIVITKRCMIKPCPTRQSQKSQYPGHSKQIVISQNSWSTL